MPIRGLLAHVDLSVSNLAESAAFYHAVLLHLGFRPLSADASNRIWVVDYGAGATFELALQQAKVSADQRAYDRYAPGLHHLAFHAADRAMVDAVHELVKARGACVLDAPAVYSGADYSPGYYAVFFCDPDGMKIEVCHIPASNP